MNRSLAAILSVFLMTSTDAQAQAELPFDIEIVTSFDQPWAMAFLPDGRMLVTEKKGNLLIVTQSGQKTRPVGGVPDVDYGGQGGLVRVFRAEHSRIAASPCPASNPSANRPKPAH